jgi:hypothetical protein
MKLVELLARELKAWPNGVTITQDYDGDVGLYSISNPDATEGSAVWRFPGHIRNLEHLSKIATDHATAIVTREMWESERARIAEPAKKASKDGWIRHRGGKCPVDKGVLVDVRFRSGDIETSDDWPRWDHKDHPRAIMAYRLHKPEIQQASVENVEAFNAQADITVNMRDPHTENPLIWRDRIREIDATVEALEEERASLVQRLEDEGLQLLPVSARPAEDMSDWRNWKVGDMAEVISTSLFSSERLSVGDIVPITDIDGEDGTIKAALGCWGRPGSNYRFHSRPSA